MTKAEYKEYQEIVAIFFKNTGINNLTPQLSMTNSTGDQEPYFSSIPCHCCQRNLAGNRLSCTGYNPKYKEILTFSCCEDCIYYAEYGQLDDMTMQEIAENSQNS